MRWTGQVACMRDKKFIQNIVWKVVRKGHVTDAWKWKDNIQSDLKETEIRFTSQDGIQWWQLVKTVKLKNKIRQAAAVWKTTELVAFNLTNDRGLKKGKQNCASKKKILCPKISDFCPNKKVASESNSLSRTFDCTLQVNLSHKP
jgi:hypothetical protein